MCGRFVAASPPAEIANYFSAAPLQQLAGEEERTPNFNVAPTNEILVVLESLLEADAPTATATERRLALRRWGLVPFWAKDPKIGNRMINARAETVATSGAFKHAFKKRRCIVVADGFYEWRKAAISSGPKTPKQPFFIRRPDGEPFAFAGLWEAWDRDVEGEPLRTATIITTTPNEAMAQIHDRMPVILPTASWAEWLNPANQDLDQLSEFLGPAPASLTVLAPVSVEVNNVRNNGPQLTDPVVVTER